MAKIHLTDRGIKALTTERAQEDFWDETFPGFGVRVTKHGKKSFAVMYRVDGRKVRMTLGPYPALSLATARKRALEAIGEAAQGRNLHAEKQARRKAETFEELAVEYMENHAKRRKKSWREDQRKIDKELLPHWRGMKVRDITRRDVVRLLEGIVERGAPATANRTLALISKMFNYALDEEIVETNPAQRVRKPAKETPRHRVLQDREIPAVWSAIDKLEPVIGATFKIRLLTAQRGVEVLSMRWQDIDGEWWTIPAEASKNGLPHRVPLAPQVLAILEELRPLTGSSEWVFESWKKRGTHTYAVRKAALQIVEESGVEFTPHDLRRTAATCMTSMGIPRLVVAKILNHVDRGVTAIYDRASYDGEKRQALVAWAARLDSMIRPE